MPAADALVIRDVTPGDAAALAGYIAALAAEAVDTLALMNPLPQPDDERRWVETTLTVPHAFILGAFDGPHVAGLIDFRPTTAPKRTVSGSFGMSVARPWRGQGLGRRLLQAMIERARIERPGLMRIELEVVPWNVGAIALYESMGFRHEGRRQRAIQFRGKPEAMLLMARTC